MLCLNNIFVAVADKEVARSITLTLLPGAVHAMMGPNGSGKSSLAQAIAGHPQYGIKQGSIELDGSDISTLSMNERACKGIFLAFQYPPSVPGLKLSLFLKEICCAVWPRDEQPLFAQRLAAALEVLGLAPTFVERNLNEGFSGGERKKCEMLQLLLLRPRVAILDEIDSGLDRDALEVVGRALEHIRATQPSMAMLIITHYQRILSYIIPHHVHIMRAGLIVASGDMKLVQQIEAQGYESIQP